MATATVSYCRVVPMGRFAGGSFGVPGDPAGQYDYFKVSCPELSEIEAAAHPAMVDYTGWVYTTEWEAHRRAVQQDIREGQRAADRKAAEAAERKRRETGRRIRETLAAAGVTSPVRQWTDNLIGGDRLSPAAREAVRGMATGSITDYDARTEDGAVYRVRVGYGLCGRPTVTRLEIV